MKLIAHLAELPPRPLKGLAAEADKVLASIGTEVGRIDLEGTHRGVAKRAFHRAAKVRGVKVLFHDDSDGSLLVKAHPGIKDKPHAKSVNQPPPPPPTRAKKTR